jgi:hypothetical protein
VCRYEPLAYSRGDRPWVPYLSVVDAYCYHGPDAARYLTAELQPWVEPAAG